MNDSEMDKLLEQSFSGPGSSDMFRAQVLRDSTAVLAKGPGHRRYWRVAGFVAAGILIAAVSFFGGRASVPKESVQRHTVVQQTRDTAQTVVVSADLIQWLKAARLFEQLGMDQRVAVAYKHAGRLIPSQTYSLDAHSQVVLVAEPDHDIESAPEPFSRDIQSILAQSLGD